MLQWNFDLYTEHVSTSDYMVPAADSCTASWNVTVDKDLNILWKGDLRNGDVRVNIEILESNLTNCLKKTSFSSKFDEEGPPVPETPCLNSAYRVVAELLCEGIVINNITKVVWTEPDVPSNVRATDVTSSSFQMNWDPPPGPVEEYKVKVNSTETNTSDTGILIQYLESDTQYSVEVSARNKYEWGSWSKAITVKTKRLGCRILAFASSSGYRILASASSSGCRILASASFSGFADRNYCSDL
ncbi:phosphatidylinositol phosphatase PTPRQ [Trichonephila clavipes]|nr:phosphatidylinositol phosphatase PTPRQ [Trichonephila clavipes]